MTLAMPAPYLTLVIPTRNDNYPSNLIPVQNKCLAILQRQLEEARIESEIIVVEYNPDASAPHLYESLRVEEGHYVTVRVITVASKHHRRFAYSDKRAFHQTCAINVGLRRSRGAFVVYRAADHIYSESLVRFLGSKTLLDDCIYRCDRFDIDKAALEKVQPEMSGGVSRICEGFIVNRYRAPESPACSGIPRLHTNACGDFLLMSRKAWLKVKGLREGRYPVFLDYDSLALHACCALGYRETILPPECRVYKINHGMKTVARIAQDWSPRWARLDRFLAANTNTATRTWARMLLNYPRRRDMTFEGVLLDSYERHFLLPATLWAHGFPFVRQNIRWGLGHKRLPERVLARANWDETARG